MVGRPRAPHAGAPWHVRCAIEQDPVPWPIVLVMEPMMSGPPWDGLVLRSTATLQEPQFSRVLFQSSFRATLEQAIVRQDAVMVVVAGEGPGSPLGRSALGIRTRAVAAAVSALPVGRRRRPVVGAAWFDIDREQLQAFELEDHTQKLRPLPCFERLLDLAASELDSRPSRLGRQ
jgi:hypothetical protein